MPGPRLVASLLKRWPAGRCTAGSAANTCPTTSTSSPSGSTGNTRARALLFYRLLQQAAGTDPHPYSEITGGTGNDWDELTND